MPPCVWGPKKQKSNSVNIANKVMKRFTSATILVVGAIMAFRSAQAQPTFIQNDLYLGFENSSTPTNYIVNLGVASGIVGSSSVVDLTSDFSLSSFGTVYLTGFSANMGVVGAASQFPGTYDIYTTILRSGGAGNAATPGSNLSGLSLNSSAISLAESQLTGLTAPAAGSGVLDGSGSWSANVEPAQTSGSFYGNTGVNPSSPVVGGGILYEDLWEQTASSSGPNAATYLGYFEMNLSGPSPVFTFTSAPEPGTATLAGIGGLSLLLLRRRFGRKNV